MVLKIRSVHFTLSASFYATLFYINSWLASDFIFSSGVHWVYLPAGLRLFLTLIFGLPGALGIAITSFLISYFGEFPHELATCIGIGLISGFAPYLARFFVLANVKLSPDLSNLSLSKLISCIFIYALLSSVLHQWWYSIRGFDGAGSVNQFFAMFIGDVLGTLILIAIVKYSLDLFKVKI